jgi:hypothetical protein
MGIRVCFFFNFNVFHLLLINQGLIFFVNKKITFNEIISSEQLKLNDEQNDET